MTIAIILGAHRPGAMAASGANVRDGEPSAGCCRRQRLAGPSDPVGPSEGPPAEFVG